MGVFAEWQATYADHNIPTFPVDAFNKKPAVGNFLKAGLPASVDFARKFPDCDAFGFACGSRSRVTVLDIDTEDEKVLADALNICGLTPIIARTHSGKWHAWYRFGGERRQIRPDKTKPVDVLGSNGFVLAPPSMGARGRYEFVSGSLDDVDLLPRMQRPFYSLEAPASKPPKGSGQTREGERNRMLWDACMRHARSCCTIDDLALFAHTMNAENFAPALPDAEVVKVVGSAWSKTQAGENWFGSEGVMQIPFEDARRAMALDPDQQALWFYLRFNHAGMRPTFLIANAMADAMPNGKWNRKRFTTARKGLLDQGVIEEVRPANRNSPAIFRFAICNPSKGAGGNRGEGVS